MIIYRSNKSFIVGTIMVLFIALFISLNEPVFPGHRQSESNYIKEWCVSKLDSVINSVRVINIYISARQHVTDKKIVQQLFNKSRYLYKQIEFYLEYNYPYDTRLINGPLVSEVEGDDLTSEPVEYPEGFQLVESMVYGKDKIRTDTLRIILSRLQANLLKLKQAVENSAITTDVFFQSLRLENERIILFNLTGFDNSFSKNGITESYHCLSGMQEGLKIIYLQEGRREDSLLLKSIYTIIKAKDYLSSHNDFDSFDRMHYVINYYLPLSKIFTEIQANLSIPYAPGLMGYDLKAGNIFAEGAVNKYFFQSNSSTLIDSAKMAIGEYLFFDPLLSGNNQRACASCHKPEFAFANKTVRDGSFESTEQLKRNTPSLINAVFQQRFFYDSRAHTLEKQMEDVMTNKKEMHIDVDEAADKLNKSSEYRDFFKIAFKEKYTGSITVQEIKECILSYEFSLISLNADFDKYMRGDLHELTASQVSGFNLFTGKAKCATCHYIPLFNGTVPPFYVKTESEVLGTTERFDTLSPVLSPDSGKYLHTGIPFQTGSFKTPSLRNVVLTAPYMHNGGFKTLEEVLSFYNKGGGQGLGLNVPDQTLDAKPLNLSSTEMNNIIEFLKSLTDTIGFVKTPTALPQFEKNASWNSREIGGNY